MPKPRILVTRRWPAAVEAVLAERFDLTLNRDDVPLAESELRQALADYDAVLPTVCDKLPAAVFSGDVRTKILGNFGVGFNHIDIATAKAKGIVVTNTPGVLTDCTADIAMLLFCPSHVAAGRASGSCVPANGRAGARRIWLARR